MKILEFAQYAYFPGLQGFEKNNTGLGIAVSDICTELAKNNEVYLITHSGFVKGCNYKNINIMKKTWGCIFANLNLKDLILARQLNKKIKPKKDRLRFYVYFAEIGYFRSIIRKLKPDIVHIQNTNIATLPFLIATKLEGYPCVVTNHGLAAYVTDFEQKYEKNYFNFLNRKSVQLTTVSNGIKERILKRNASIPAEYIRVVYNGFSIHENERKETFNNKFSIKQSDVVFLCIGKISRRKNQIEIVNALSKVSKEDITNIKVIFVGDGAELDNLKKHITQYNLEDHAICIGNIIHDEMSEIYAIGDYVISASLDEGFGLPFIEGFSYGLPAITFSDLDAVKDIYDDECMLLIQSRDTDSLAKEIVKAKDLKWNKEIIIEHSLSFTLDKAARDYEIVFNGVKKHRHKIFRSDFMEFVKTCI